MKPQKHQKKATKKLLKKLSKHSLAILSGEPRSGKTVSFLSLAKNLSPMLVVTQKSALSDISKAVCSMNLSSKVTVTNYHQVKNLLASKKYALIVIDEAHRWIGGYPKMSQLWKDLKVHTLNTPVIYSSGTLTPETFANLFPMLSLSSWSPWVKYQKVRLDWQFNKWFRDYGYPYKIKINGFDVAKYDRMDDKKIFKDVKKYVVTITRADAGHKHEAVDKLHRIELPKEQTKFIKKLKKKLFVEKDDMLFMGDTPAKMGQKLHQISGGFIKDEDGTVFKFRENPKVEYIKRNWNPETTIILAHFKAEQEYIKSIFPHTGSTTRNSEGVDYSHFKDMVIYSHSHASSTFEQVRQRQANINRKWKITPHFLIAGDVDQSVYEIASGKKPNTRRWYES